MLDLGEFVHSYVLSIYYQIIYFANYFYIKTKLVAEKVGGYCYLLLDTVLKNGLTIEVIIPPKILLSCTHLPELLFCFLC